MVRTYAPCGETPVLKVFQTRDHLSVMSGISTAGHLVTLTRTRALTGQESVTFLRHLYGYEVKVFLANGWAKKIHLENFPTYAPELNPDEGVWQHLKQVELRNLCCMDLIHLNIELQLAIRRLRRKQDLIQSFFAGAGLDL